ncbi:hypothetical protein VN97_g11186 [Penicillium thymicola]|uniref:Uncharacterized protein n=1 Tax=Penicillium thymicola TaxID=293382 RepID=A0AAI9T944_PENTH|nr:hypothetical protein VN97_g11186 [Penicillium thymicola]
MSWKTTKQEAQRDDYGTELVKKLKANDTKTSQIWKACLCIPIWHIFIAQILDTVDFPIALPVGDLSRYTHPWKESESLEA